MRQDKRKYQDEEDAEDIADKRSRYNEEDSEDFVDNEESEPCLKPKLSRYRKLEAKIVNLQEKYQELYNKFVIPMSGNSTSTLSSYDSAPSTTTVSSTASTTLNEDFLHTLCQPELLDAWDKESSGSKFFDKSKTRSQSVERKLQGDYYKKVIDIIVLGGSSYIETSRSHYNMALNTVAHYIYSLMTNKYNLLDIHCKSIRNDLSEYVI